MKHGILLIAYHNIEHVLRFISKLDDDFRVFIHLDTKTALAADERKLLLQSRCVSYIGQKHMVNWGSFGIVRATLTLCKKALEYPGLDYFHLVSDADYLSVNLNTFKRFFEDNIGKNYIEYEKFPVKAWFNGGYDRVNYLHRLEKYDIRTNVEDERKYSMELRNQMRTSQLRALPPFDLYGGSAWWSLTADCVRYLVNHEDMVEEYFLDTKFPDEDFAQSLIMSSPFAQSVVDDNKRYVLWKEKHGSLPAVLDEDDLVDILAREKFFIRKVDPMFSKQLLSALDFYIIENGCEVDVCQFSISSLVSKAESLMGQNYKGGLFLGNGGLLVFLSELLRLGLVARKRVCSCLETVLREFDESQDDSYETGRLGIVVCLEHAFNVIGDMYPQNVSEMLDRVALQMETELQNLEGEEICPHMQAVFRVYFLARKYGGRFSKTDLASLKLLGRLPMPQVFKHRVTNVRLHASGLLGYSGLGLDLLEKMYNKSNIKWAYLIL